MMFYRCRVARSVSGGITGIIWKNIELEYLIYGVRMAVGSDVRAWV